MGVEIPIADGFYRSSSLPIDSQRCVNAYPLLVEMPSFQRQSLLGTPGVKQLVDTTQSTGCRGAMEMNDIPYFVFGTTLYKLVRTISSGVESFSVTSLGTVAGTDRVSMAQNGTQLVILRPGSTGYVYNRSTGAFATISDSDFTANGNPQYVRYVDGYFAFSTDAQKLIVSSLNDGTAYNALDFGSAEADPDSIVTLQVTGGRLLALGTETTQVFQNIGGTDFPFQAIPASTIPTGCYAPFSVVDAGGSFAMIGGGERESASVYYFTGNGYEKISNEAIDYLIEQLSDTELANVNGWSYADRSSSFAGWQLNATTIVYDFTNGRWHERQTRTFDADGFPAQVAWRCSDILRGYGRMLVGDRLDGLIGHCDLDIYDEYGNEILRWVSTQPLDNAGDSFSISRIEATTESGGTTSTTLDPKLRMSLSRDGIVFGPEKSRDIGKVGEREKRQIWRKNGWFDRVCVMRFLMSDKAKFSIVKVEADFG